MRSGEHRKKRTGPARGREPGRSAPRGQDGGAGGRPGVRRGRGHSPPPPRRAAGPVTAAARRARPQAGRGVEGRGGEGAARPTMQSARRRRHRPVAKVKGRVQPPRPPWRRRPALRRAAARPSPAARSYLRVGRHNSRGAGPVSAAGAPGTEGSERARRAPEGRSPGARAARAPRRAGAERGGGLGPTAAGVVEGPRFVIVFVSERSEFVTPVPLPPPPARWEEEGECSSSSSRRQPHHGGGGRASTLLAERARAPERRCRRRS